MEAKDSTDPPIRVRAGNPAKRRDHKRFAICVNEKRVHSPSPVRFRAFQESLGRRRLTVEIEPLCPTPQTTIVPIPTRRTAGRLESSLAIRPMSLVLMENLVRLHSSGEGGEVRTARRLDFGFEGADRTSVVAGKEAS